MKAERATRLYTKRFFWYTMLHMAKRASQDIKNKTSRSKKTKKRMAVKHAKIAVKKAKKTKK